MSKIRNSKIAKAVAGLTLAAVMVLGGVATPAQAQSVAELTAQINSLLATISSLQAQLAALQGGGSGSTGTGMCSYTFAQNLSQGDSGTDVRNLQMVLNMDPTTQVAASGVGSPGNETNYFGSLTRAAVVKFQNKYASEVLAPVGLSQGTGYVGPSTRAKLNSICSGTGTGTGPGTGTGTGPGTGTGAGGTATVSAAAQPANSLAVFNAARVPFTRFTITAGASPVTLNSVTVERTGLAQDENFAGVVLLDENGTQIGIDKTLNSNHQATVGETTTIPAGTSKTFTVAGNMAGQATVNAGEVAALSVVAVNTNATLSGSLPITGAQHTINATLTVGTVTADRGPLDPNAAQTREVGTTGYTFSSVRLTAGSQEDIRLNSIRWNQSGSVGTSDLANVRVVVDGTEYTPTVSADGKYYAANFGSGIVIAKGLNKEISIKADIVSGSGRTVAFDIYKFTDINVTGELYGYGITPTRGTGFNSTSPVFDASVVTISGGSMVVTRSNTVASQSIAVNVANQPFGAVEVDVEGEPISVQSIVFDVATTAGDSAWTGLITDVTLVDGNGAVVAGPKDMTASQTSVTFTDTVTFPVGETVYTVRGKLPSTASNNATVVLTTNPGSDWTTVTGQQTGNAITPTPGTDQALQTMTAKAALVSLSVATTPSAQTVVAGTQDFTFANYQFDATASGEDIRFSSIPLEYSPNGNTATSITSCALFDGANQLTTGSNVVNPTAAASSTTFTFDSPMVVPKGTVKTISLKCDISSSATGTYNWGYDTSASPSATGLTSGAAATITENDSVGQIMTIAASGTLTVTEDASSPAYRVGVAGTTDNTVGVLKFTAANEPIDLTRVALQLSNSSASSTVSDVTKVSLWDGATKVGEAVFTGSSRNATSTLTSTVTVPKDGDKLLTIKVDLAQIGSAQPGTQGALVQVDYDADDSTGTRGIGQGSGSTINATGSDTSVEGIRLYNTAPTFARHEIPSTTLTAGTKVLYRWSVTADAANDLGVAKFTFDVATTGATVTSMNVYGYTDANFSSPVSGVQTGGKFDATDQNADGNRIVEVYAENTSGTRTPLTIPAGATRYFELRGTATTDGTADSVVTQLEGDAAHPSLATLMATLTGADADTNNDFIWSPYATTTSTINHVDWTNGFGVNGLPTTNMDSSVLSN